RAAVPVDALRLLELLDDPPALARALAHPTTPVRRRAAQLLAERGAAEPLLAGLRAERDPSLRIALVEHLGRLRSREAADPLIAIAASRQEADDLRGAACLALGRIGDPAALEPLLDLAQRSSRGLGGLFRTTSTALRVSALRALGLFDAHAEAREALKAAADEDDPVVAEAAKEGLGARLQKAFDRPKEDAPKKPTVKLAGSIQEIPIDQICQLIGGAEKSGLLQLDFDGTPGRVWFEGGFVVAAECDGRLDQDAVNGFVGRKSGSFMFHPGEAAPAHRMRMPVHNVLLEAFRVADEEQKIS
ncbi:MAG TPA: HEAT repeat domain-containing protein, partial [Planctomycetota bacterium]|nr:HEAT repeat domain-containing protein [Planctomycetota bacterium]